MHRIGHLLEITRAFGLLPPHPNENLFILCNKKSWRGFSTFTNIPASFRSHFLDSHYRKGISNYVLLRRNAQLRLDNL